MQVALRAARRVVPSAILAALAACASPPREPFEPPALVPTWHYHAGSLLSGPQPEETAPPLDEDPAHALVLRVSVGALERLPTDWPRLASRARLVVSDADDHSLRGVANRLAGALCVEGEDAIDGLAEAGPASWVHMSTVLLPGTTAALSLGPFPDSQLLELRLAVARGDTLTPGLFVRGQRLPSGDPDEPVGTGESRELVIAQPSVPTDGSPLLLAAPFPLPKHPRAGLLFVLSAVPGAAGDAAHAAATAAVAEDVRRAAAETNANAAELTANESFLRQVVSAFGAMKDEASRRSALAFLAGAADAPLCADITLLADEPLLTELVAQVDAGARDLQGLVSKGGGLGWLLERSTFELLISRATQAPLPAELQAELLRVAGEAGRFPSAMHDVIGDCGSLAQLRARLIQENLVYLEDPTAGARVRAAEWLETRGKLPEGYDPYAPLAERRAAIARAEAAAESAP